MVNVGVPANFVDTQDVNLTNLSDAKTYKQLTNVTLSISRTVHKHFLTDDTIENLASMRHISMSGKMVLTNPQVADLITLTGTGSAAPVSKVWSIAYVDSSNTTKTLSINGQLMVFDIIDTGISVTTANFSIEGDETAGVT